MMPDILSDTHAGSSQRKVLGFIRSTGAVSPQTSYEQLIREPARYSGEQLTCIEPDYTQFIDPRLIRRMSRIIKMGMAAAMQCLRDAGLDEPDAIITGTAYGCLADTNVFLTRMVEFKETLLSPTAFIQSTHNTVGAQIALQLKCHQYNNTYVHRGASFESAMMDAISLLAEGAAQHLLVGAADEITENSHAILRRFGNYREAGDSRYLAENPATGTMAGEGAAFFTLTRQPVPGSLAALEGMQIRFEPTADPGKMITAFMQQLQIDPDQIDLVLLGINGDRQDAAHYQQATMGLFDHSKIRTYKNYCGEYPSSAAFALWLAVNMLQDASTANGKPPQRILIYNNYKLQYPALYLLAAC
ncbi:beta-ketoacyl synthase chain length factor [Niabella terrae]